MEENLKPSLDGDIKTKGKHPVTGKFLPKNACSRGNPFIKEVNQLRSFLFQQIRKDDWAAVKKALIDGAKSGDIKAMTILLSYALGKPAQSLDINVTEAKITPEEASERIRKFFNL